MWFSSIYTIHWTRDIQTVDKNLWGKNNDSDLSTSTLPLRTTQDDYSKVGEVVNFKEGKRHQHMITTPSAVLFLKKKEKNIVQICSHLMLRICGRWTIMKNMLRWYQNMLTKRLDEQELCHLFLILQETKIIGTGSWKLW